MEKHIESFVEMLKSINPEIENTVINSFIVGFADEADKGKLMSALRIFNRHGISSKALTEALKEIMEGGVL